MALFSFHKVYPPHPPRLPRLQPLEAPQERKLGMPPRRDQIGVPQWRFRQAQPDAVQRHPSRSHQSVSSGAEKHHLQHFARTIQSVCRQSRRHASGSGACHIRTTAALLCPSDPLPSSAVDLVARVCMQRIPVLLRAGLGGGGRDGSGGHVRTARSNRNRRQEATPTFCVRWISTQARSQGTCSATSRGAQSRPGSRGTMHGGPRL